MYITQKHLSRRTMLRGLGAALGLPLLDSMVPAAVALQQTAARPLRRLGVVYVPNGMNMAEWTPSAEGDAFPLSSILEPLAPVREHLLVVSGTCSELADAQMGEGGGDHSRGQAAFLTGAHAKKVQGGDAEAGISMDQIAALELGRETQLASLELALEQNDVVGGCEFGLSCAYSSTIAWRNATTPIPMEADPRAVFERMFGAADSTDPRARALRLRRDRSVLDSVMEQLARLDQRIGPGDRAKVTEYADAVRDVERRIQTAEKQSRIELPSVEQPAGVPTSFEAYGKVMFDLLALAYQTDLTRVCTFLVGREQSGRTYPEVGVPEAHHPISHHAGNPGQLAKLAKVNRFHMTLFAHLLERLRSTPDGDGSLLDHSVLLYGAGISDSNMHLHHELPILLAGGGAGRIRGNRHLRVGKHTPLANLHVSVLEKLGVPVERLGDSTGRIETLSGV
jgi:hypothetical protein